jgi:membrane protease YdiL (CAAX protease family)
VNDSPSTISPDWPTRWPKHSFRPGATILISAILVAPFAVAFFLNAGMPAAPPAPASFAPASVDLMLALTFTIEALLALLVLAALRPLSGLSPTQLGFRKVPLRALLTAIAGGIVMSIVADGSATLVDSLFHRQHEQHTVLLFRSLHDPYTMGAFILFATVFAPFAEETIFRVFFFNAGLRYGGFWLGAIVSSALFGMAHGDVYFAVPLALGGFVLCGVYYFTRNAFASMISHSFFNALTVATLLLERHIPR